MSTRPSLHELAKKQRPIRSVVFLSARAPASHHEAELALGSRLEEGHGHGPLPFVVVSFDQVVGLLAGSADLRRLVDSFRHDADVAGVGVVAVLLAELALDSAVKRRQSRLGTFVGVGVEFSAHGGPPWVFVIRSDDLSPLAQRGIVT